MITNTMLPEMGREFLSRLASGGVVNRVHVTTDKGEFVYNYE